MPTSVFHAIPKTIAIILAGFSLSWSSSALAAKHERTSAVVVVRPSDLALSAQKPGQECTFELSVSVDICRSSRTTEDIWQCSMFPAQLT